MRIDIYTPGGVLLKTIVPRERTWTVDKKDNGMTHIRLKSIPPGSCDGIPRSILDRLHIHGDVIVIIHEDETNNKRRRR